MTQKTLKTIGWVITSCLALIFAMSAFMKLSQNEEAIAQAAAIGIDALTYQIIGVVEVVALLLFLIPRTSLLGSLLLIAYMGGAIATHLQHQQPMTIALTVEILLWIVVIIRYPDVRQRLLPIPTKAH
jgi:uncharacterized membrane protein YphA (DoxX/SURF4 family)